MKVVISQLLHVFYPNEESKVVNMFTESRKQQRLNKKKPTFRPGFYGLLRG